MDLWIPPRNIKNMLESNPLKSRFHGPGRTVGLRVRLLYMHAGVLACRHAGSRYFCKLACLSVLEATWSPHTSNTCERVNITTNIDAGVQRNKHSFGEEDIWKA